MKGLQGMVRSLIGTVADQHDNTLKIQQQLEQGKNTIPHDIIPYHNQKNVTDVWLKISHFHSQNAASNTVQQ